MIALDTNILARYLLNDTPEQASAAQARLAGPEWCTAPITVFLELVWVLESRGLKHEEISFALRHLYSIKHFMPQYFDVLASALQWYESGMDFADSIHLAMSTQESAFITFDKSLFKKARRLGAFPEVILC